MNTFGNIVNKVNNLAALVRHIIYLALFLPDTNLPFDIHFNTLAHAHPSGRYYKDKIKDPNYFE